MTARRPRKIISILTKAFVASSFDIAVRLGITTYEASDVALAARLAVPLITADTKLVRALVETPYYPHWLGEVPFLPT